MFIFSTLVYILLSLYPITETYRILGIFPFPGRSHMFMFERIMKGLAEAGHTVDVVSHFPQEKLIPRYNDLSLKGTLFTANNLDIDYINSNLVTSSDFVHAVCNTYGSKLCEKLFNTTILQQLKSTNVKYDLLVLPILSHDCFLGFKHIMNIPIVGITTSADLPWGAATRIGNPDNPSYIPNYFSPFSNQMNLYERYMNIKEIVTVKFKYSKCYADYNKIARKFFGNDLPDIEKLAKQTNLILSNTHFSINYPRPTVPNFIEIGGVHIDTLKPLSEHYRNFLNVELPYKGIIYFNMGTVVSTETFPKITLEELFETFQQLPYKILWKAKQELIPKDIKIPSNIYFESWVPQIEILCHKNVKLFISHGGLSGSHEAVYCEVPILGIPVFCDQHLNSKALEENGVARVINYENISKNRLLDLITELLENSTYRNNSKRLSTIFKDRPLSPLKTAIYWIEYVIRHNGAPHLRSASADIPWYQYYLLDIATIVTIFIICFALVIYCILLCILNLVSFCNVAVDKPKLKIE